MAQDKYSQNRQLAYDLLKQEGYTDIGDSAEELFKNKANAELAYKLLTDAGYTDLGADYNEFSSMLYAPEQASAATLQPSRSTKVTEQPAQTVDPQAAAEGRSLFNQMTAARRGTSSLSDAPQATQDYLNRPLSKEDKDKYTGKAGPSMDEMYLGAEQMKQQALNAAEKYQEAVENPKLARFNELIDKAQSTKLMSADEYKEMNDLYSAPEVNPMAQLKAAIARRNFNNSPEGEFARLSQQLSKLDKHSKEYEAVEKAWTETEFYKTKSDGLKNAVAGLAEKTRESLGIDPSLYTTWFKMMMRNPATNPSGVLPDTHVKDTQAATSRMLAEAAKILNDPSKYDDTTWLQRRGRFAKEYGKEMVNPEMWLKSLFQAEDALPLRNVFGKIAEHYGNVDERLLKDDDIDNILDEDEKNLLRAYFMLSEAQTLRPEVADYIQSARSAANSTKFIIEMAISGEALGFNALEKKLYDEGAKKLAATYLAKWAEKQIVWDGTFALAAKAGQAVTKLAGKSLLTYATSYPAVLFHPTTWGDFAERMSRPNEDGKYDPDALKEAWGAIRDQQKERWTETLGETVFNEFLGSAVRGLGLAGRKALGNGLAGKMADEAAYRFSEIGDYISSTKPAQFIKKAANSSWGQKVRQIAEATHFDGIGPEIGEEALGAAIDVFRQKSAEPLRDFFTWDNLIMTGESFLPMYIWGGGFSAAGLAASRIKYGHSSKRLENLMKKYGYSDEQVQYIFDQTKGAAPSEISRLLADMGANITNSRFGAAAAVVMDDEQVEIVNALKDYLRDSVEYNTYDAMREEEEAGQREVLKRELEDNYGHKFYIDADDNNPQRVVRARVNDGKGGLADVFLLDDKPGINGKYYAMYPDGQMGWVGVEDMAPMTDEAGNPVLDNLGRFIPSFQAQTLDAFLSEQVMAQRQTETAVDNTNRLLAANATLMESVKQIEDNLKHNGKDGYLVRSDESGAEFRPFDDDGKPGEFVPWAQLAIENGITTADAPIPTAEDEVEAEGESMAQAVISRRNIAEIVNLEGENSYTIEQDGKTYRLIYALPGSVDAVEGRITGVFAGPNGERRAFSFAYDDVLNPRFEGEGDGVEPPAAPKTEPEPTPAPAAEETPTEEAPQSKIPVDKDGNKIYDAPGVEPIDAYDDMYSTPGLSEEDVDEWVIAQSDEAEKNRNPKIKKGQSLADWGKEKAEANRKADFWKQFRDIAEERAKEREEARKQEAERQKEIEKYGVDTRGFDLTPQTVEEAVADYLGNSDGIIDLDDAKKEVFGKSGRIPSELFRHAGNGGILTKKGGRTIADVANDIVGEYEGQLPIEQDAVRDLIIDYIARYTKTEMREMIFNNRLTAALAELEQQNGASSEAETAEAVEDMPAAEEEDIPASEAVEEAPEGTAVPEVEEPVAEPAEPETTTAEEDDALLENETQEIRDAVDAVVSGKDAKKREVKSTLPDDFTIGGMDVNSYIRSRYDRFKAPLEKRREEIRKDYVAYRTRVENEARADILRNNPQIKEDNPYLPDYVSEEANKRLKNDEQFNALDAQIKAIDDEIGNYQTRRYNALAAIEEIYESQKPAETPENNAPESSETPGNSVPSQEEETATTPGVPTSAAEIRNVVEARAYFENLYGKGRRADNSVRVWELTHKTPVTRNENGGLKSQMAMALEGVSGLSQEEAAELVTLGTQLAEDFINDGFVKFPQFFKTIVETFGDGIRPFTKSIYLGASANVSDEIADQMDDRKTVRTFDTSIDINNISDEQNDSNTVSELREPVSEPGSESAGENVPAGESEVSGTDTGSGVEDTDTEGAGSPAGDGRLGDGGESVSGAGEQRPGETRGTGAGRGRSGRPAGSGRPRGTGRSNRPGDTSNTESGEDTSRGLGVTEQEAAEAEAKAYETEKDAIKSETDTNKLKARKDELKSKISAILEVVNLEKAKMQGQLRAVLERLRDLFSSNAKKSEALAQEKVPYQTLSDPEGAHAFGSVVPSGSADAMRDAIKRLEAEEGKNVAQFVMDELGYKSLDEMFSGETKNEGLSSEQVDSVGLAIHQMKKGKMFIVGDMTGVGKGRQGAALIRWAKRQGKKVLFVTEKPDLFSDMYGDLADIGTKNLLPFIVNDDADANITEKNSETEEKVVLVRHPGKAEYDALYKSESDELPAVKRGPHKGKKYDFVMMTYSQAQSARTANAKRKLDWVKLYAKDAIVICDESHNASGDSARGNYFRDIVSGAQGVTFMSATFAKRPDNMVLYALRSSMGDAQMTTEDMIEAIQKYGIPMQEILASSLFKTGEMVRRERDFSDVKTHWQEPNETYTPEEIKQGRDTFDRSMGVVNSIIDFQRRVVDGIIRKLNEDFEEHNKKANEAIASGEKGTIREYVTTPYSSQVSNVANLMFYAIKARKAADMAIEQIKRGEKPVIAVENTLESYLKDIDGDVASADFAFVLNRGLARSLNYRYKETTKQFNKETGKAEVIKEESTVTDMGSIEPRMGEQSLEALETVRQAIAAYSLDKDVMPLMLSPIDYIKRRIEDAGYKCGEITGRSLQLVQAPDGTYHTEAFQADKKKAIAQFNNGTTDALILNTAGSTGISLHASRRFKDQKKRTMIILQPARDPNTEVQVRGRVDRTGQVSRAEYFYITSPIPAERKVIMMLRQKLASLDANSVGTENVSSNRVNADDMDNKYGDEVARQFLSEHPEINAQLDDSKQIEQKKGEWIGREGLLYDLLIGIQRMTCADQEMILEELQTAYKDQIEYLNQNGINDLATTTMNLEAVTIDSGLFIKGKDNESMSEFAHDTNIERVEVNVLNKPLRSSDIYTRMKKLGVVNEDGVTKGPLNEDGTINDEYGTEVVNAARRSKTEAEVERIEKHRAAEAELEAELRKRYPKTANQTEEEYAASINMIPQLASLKDRNKNDEERYTADLEKQVRAVVNAARYFKPGMPMFVPLTDEISQNGSAPLSYGRFIGFKVPKDGKPKGIKAVFAVKDSRASIELPVVSKADVVQNIIDTTYGSLGFGGSSLRDIGGPSYDRSLTDETRRQARDEWWDKMIPKDTNRQIRYMVTGNILQACGSLGKYKGTITTFTRKDPETGEISVERGMLLAEDFDPENFMVRSAVTKDDIWEGYDQVRDDITYISAQREGNRMVVNFDRKGREKLSNHPIMKDDGFKELIIGGEIDAYSKDRLRAYISEENVEKALEYLYKNYSFTKGHLFVMPDSTERVDAIVYTDKPYNDVIKELSDKLNASDWTIDSKIRKALLQYKMDVNNEELKTRIREMVQLRQAYLRKRYAKGESSRLAWQVIIEDQNIERAKDDKSYRDSAFARREAIKEELESRGVHGHAMHFESGKTKLDDIIKTFNDLNQNPTNAKIAKKVFAIAKRLNLDIVMNEKAIDSGGMGNNTGGQTAGNLVEYNWKYMNAEWITDQMKADTILHELVHTATVYAKRLVESGDEHLLMQENPAAIDAVQVLDALYDAIRRNQAFTHRQSEEYGDYYTDYGVQDWFEMLAEGGSNEAFREDLKKVKVAPRLVSGFVRFTDVTDTPGYSGRTQTAWEALEEQLNVLLDNFGEHAYTEMWRGTGYGERSYQTLVSAENESTNKILDAMEQEYDIPIHRVSRSQMPRGHKSDKGYYNPSTGEMTICMDNVTDERDAIVTVLHETVGHHGLRKLFGDRFNDAMARIYAALDQKGKTWVNGYIARHPNADNTRAVEEYLSHLAESGNFKNTVWDNIRRIIGRIVDALFGTNGFLLTDNELNYILRASYENLKNPNWLNTVEGRAFDTLLKRQLGINETDPNKPTDPQGPDAGRLYRDGDTGVANDDYNREVDRKWNKALTENQDADRPVRIGMDKVMKEKGIKSISEDEDYVTRHNLASSRAESEAHEFELFRFTPLMDQVRAIQSRLLGKKATAADREQAYQRILDYMYAVSGLERNASKNAEIEQAKQAKLADAAAAGITDPAKLAEIEKKYEDMKRDWSGLTSLMGMSKDNWQAAETAAQGMISAFEGAIGDKAALDELWNRVRACTDFSLEHAYQHGLLTREEFERLHGTASQPRMWEYYLPLRGFSETTTEELFNYETFTNPSRGNVVVKKMNGRWTQADNPLANILNIAETEIVQGNDNWAKQALYRFTLNAGDNTLLFASEPWFVKNPATGKWSMAFPDPGETLEEFEERMKALRALDDPLAKKGRRGLKLENIMANKAHRNEHAIHLKVGGIDKMIWVNGNPALAKAVSGIGRAQNLQWLRRASRALSNLFTTYSLDFTAKNLIRDTVYSNIALHVKEDKAYRHQYYKNWVSNFGYGAFAFPMVRLAAEWDSGKLQQKEKAGTLTKREQDFLNFMRDGGQTGYTIINSVNQIKKDLEKQMRSAGGRPGTVPILGWYAKAVKTLNEGFELLTRFTAYQTSRDMGRSGQRAASDAKEISVNFNRRGAQSGQGIWGNIAAYLGATHYFYNAGVQGFDNFLGLFKKKPVKMSAITAGFVMMGVLTPLINSMLAGLIGGGDGDDDWYWNLPEWVRRNNLVIGTGKWYVALPLPVEFRAPYGIGDIAGAAFSYDKYPNRTFGSVAGDIITTASGILPVNPIEGYTSNGNIGDAAIRAVAPDAGMFFVDWATNRDYTGRPLWKENPFSDTVPKSQGAYASTPKGIVAACQKLAEVSNGSIDIAPGVVRDFMNNYGGGFFRAAEDVSKLLFTDEERPRRWDNVPFFSGFTGHIDEDRSNSFAQGALYDYKKLSEGNVKDMNAILNTDDVTSAVLYDEPESLYEREGVTVLQKAKIKRMLDSKDYALGKMYREGMNNKYKMKQSMRDGHWYKSRDIERKGVDALRQDWKDLRDQWAKMPGKTAEEKSAKAKVEEDVQEAWHLYYDAMGDLAEKLMDYEYNK